MELDENVTARGTRSRGEVESKTNAQLDKI
jgi:hypothetical protein